MAVSFGRRYRFTVDQYHRMGEMGLFHPECRVELVDGEIFEMTPIDPWHAGVVDWLTHRFVSTLGDRAVRVQNPVGLDTRSEPQPEIVLLRPQKNFYRPGRGGCEHVLPHDRGRKLPLYAKTGVREVWIVSRQADAIEVFRAPSSKGYREHEVVRRGGYLAPAAFPERRLAVDDILG